MVLKALTDGVEHDGAELGPLAPPAGGLVSVLRHSSEFHHIILETFHIFFFRQNINKRTSVSSGHLATATLRR